MSGFMAGFGSAFAQSFGQAEQERAQKEEDQFKLMYSDAISRRDKLDEINRENAKNIKASKALVAMTGQPPGAWGEVYKLKSAGISDEAIIKQLKDNEAVIAPQVTSPGDTSGPADPRDGLTQGAQTSVDSQMATSGMQTPQDGGIFGGVKSSIQDATSSVFGTPEERAKKKSDKMNSRIADTMGTTPEELQKIQSADTIQGDPVPGIDGQQVSWKPRSINAGIKPEAVNNLGDATAYKIWADEFGTDADKARGQQMVDQFGHMEATKAHNQAIELGTGFQFARAAIRDDKGGWTGGVARPEPDGNGGEVWKDDKGNIVDEKNLRKFDKNMEADITDQEKTLGPDVQKYNQDVIGFQAMVRTADSLTSLSKQNPEAMGLSGDISQWVDYFKRAGVNIAKIATGPKLDEQGNIIPDTGALGEAEKAEQMLENQLKGPMDRNSKNALVATLIDVKATKLAYMWAQDMGQQGRSVSNKDFQNFKDAAKGNENPEALGLSAADFIAEKYKNLKNQEVNLNQNAPIVSGFKKKYGIDSPFKVTGVDETIASDPELKGSLDRFNDTSKNSSLNSSDNNDAPEAIKSGKALDFEGKPFDPEAWQYLSDETKTALKAKNGIKE